MYGSVWWCSRRYPQGQWRQMADRSVLPDPEDRFRSKTRLSPSERENSYPLSHLFLIVVGLLAVGEETGQEVYLRRYSEYPSKLWVCRCSGTGIYPHLWVYETDRWLTSNEWVWNGLWIHHKKKDERDSKTQQTKISQKISQRFFIKIKKDYISKRNGTVGNHW